MKTNLKKKFWMKLLSGFAALVALTIPAITLVSCAESNNDNNSDLNNGSNIGSGSNSGSESNNNSNSSNGNCSCCCGSNNGNNSNNSNNSNNNNFPSRPKPVMTPPNTSHITTFKDAKAFAKEYLKKNYNFDLFALDVNFSAHLHSNQLLLNIESNGTKILNSSFKFSIQKENEEIITNSELIFDGEYKGKKQRAHLVNTVRNLKISPILVLRNNVLYLELAISHPVAFHSSYPPYYFSFEELKSENPDWKEKAILNNTAYQTQWGLEEIYEDLWIVIKSHENDDFIFKPYRDGTVIYVENWITTKTYSLPVMFHNVKDINDNLLPSIGGPSSLDNFNNKFDLNQNLLMSESSNSRVRTFNEAKICSRKSTK